MGKMVSSYFDKLAWQSSFIILMVKFGVEFSMHMEFWGSRKIFWWTFNSIPLNWDANLTKYLIQCYVQPLCRCTLSFSRFLNIKSTSVQLRGVAIVEGFSSPPKNSGYTSGLTSPSCYRFISYFFWLLPSLSFYFN